MKSVILLAILLPFILMAQSEWTFEFSVEAPGTTIFIRSFGVADGATDGYDVLNDLPLFVGTSDTTVFFAVESGFISALSRDVRSNRSSSHQWNLTFQNMPPSGITWLPDSLPEDGDFEASVHHADSTPSLWFDMRETPFLVVPLSREVTFKWTVPTGEDTIPPYVSAWSPADGDSFVPRETDIYCEIYDDGAGVDDGTIELRVGGINVTWLAEIDSIDGGFSVSYDPLMDFGWNTDVTCILSAYDLETPSNYVSDTIRWRTLPDSLAYEVSGTVSVGDPPFPISGAVVTISDRAETTGSDGYYHFDSISEGAYTIRASAPGYTQSSRWVWIDADTVFNFLLEIAPTPDVLIIDYDSGSQPFEDDTTGEERKIASLLDFIGYTYDITSQNPDISTLDLMAYTYIIVVTPVRGDGSHTIIPDAGLTELADWLADDGRILWVAPDGGPDYAEGTSTASAFFNMFGAEFENEGRPYSSDGNIRRLTGSADDFILDLDVSYDHETPADNYIDELSAVESTAYVPLWSQVTDPAPLSSAGRMVFYDSGTYRSVVTSIHFGGINDGIFPNSAFNILRTAMDYLDKPSKVEEAEPELPSRNTIRVHPNPFNSVCTIIADEDIEIFDVSGRRVMELSPSKEGKMSWFGRDEQGIDMPSGVYLIRGMNTGATARAVLLK